MNRNSLIPFANASDIKCCRPCTFHSHAQILLTTLGGKTVALPISAGSNWKALLHAAQKKDTFEDRGLSYGRAHPCRSSKRTLSKRRLCDTNNLHRSPVVFLHQGRPISLSKLALLSRQYSSKNESLSLSMKVPILGGIDRQNRVGSKFGGGGVSSGQQSERERKERLKQLALESIDLAKDPYLMRNHLGSYECKLCLTLHTNEANYLAHTQGKKHQQGLARRAQMEKLRKEREGQSNLPVTPTATKAPMVKKVRIGRPAYQVFKSRDSDTQQRCLSFELSYPEIEEDLQPRHRFMSAFEQRVESPPDRRYQYLLFAADPYETVAFKVPNEPIDKEPGRFVTHWDSEEKKFTLTMYFVEQKEEAAK